MIAADVRCDRCGSSYVSTPDGMRPRCSCRWVDLPRPRRPWTCPVCAGMGKIDQPGVSVNTEKVDCPACNATGIVWG